MDEIINPELLQICLSNRVEIAVITDTVYFVSAHEMEQGFKEKCRELVPDKLKVDFRVNIKPSTGQMIANTISKLGAMQSAPDIQGKHLNVRIVGRVLIDPAPVWEKINDLIKNDGFFDSWTIILNDETVHEYRPVYEEIARNKRERVISSDDITNLRISLGRAETVEDFINSI